MVLLTNKKSLIIIILLAAFVFSGLGGIFYATASEEPTPAGTPLPVIMYHMVAKNSSKSSKYVVSEKQLEEDFEYIRKQGFTPITSFELLSGNLPEKPIMITFDDGYFNNYSYLFPLLKKYDFHAIISIIGKQTEIFSNDGKPGNNNYSHVTWEQIKEMQGSGLVEIGNHTFNLHSKKTRRGVLRKKGEDKEEYEKMLLEDVGSLQNLLEEKVGKKPTVFAFPFGHINNESQEIIKKLGFSVTLGCQEGMNYITADPKSLINLKRYNRSGKRSTESFFEKIEKFY